MCLGKCIYTLPNFKYCLLLSTPCQICRAALPSLKPSLSQNVLYWLVLHQVVLSLFSHYHSPEVTFEGNVSSNRSLHKMLMP